MTTTRKSAESDKKVKSPTSGATCGHASPNDRVHSQATQHTTFLFVEQNFIIFTAVDIETF